MRIARIAAVLLSLTAGLAGALLVSPTDAASTPGSPSAAAASAFLKSLPADLRASASFPLEAPERLVWNFVPMDRVGVSLLKLDDAQSELLGPLLATALSPEGLLAARGVMKHENILRRVETEAGVANASRRDPGLYYTAIFGKPTAAAWLALRRTPSLDQRHRAPGRSTRGRAHVRRRKPCARARGTQCRLSVARRGGRPRP